LRKHSKIAPPHMIKYSSKRQVDLSDANCFMCETLMIPYEGATWEAFLGVFEESTEIKTRVFVVFGWEYDPEHDSLETEVTYQWPVKVYITFPDLTANGAECWLVGDGYLKSRYSTHSVFE